MGNSNPASTQGSLPSGYNSATTQSSKKRKRADDFDVDYPLHAYHHLPRHPLPQKSFLGQKPLPRSGFPQQSDSSLIRSSLLGINLPSSQNILTRQFSQQNDRFGASAHSLSSPRPTPPEQIGGAMPTKATLQDHQQQGRIYHSIPAQSNTPAAFEDHVPRNSFIIPGHLQQGGPSILDHHVPQNQFIRTALPQGIRPHVRNDVAPQNQFVPPRLHQQNESLATYTQRSPQFQFNSPIPVPENRNSVSNNNNIQQKQLISPFPIDRPLGLDNELSPFDNGYPPQDSQDSQGDDDHFQSNMNNGREGQQELPLGDAISALQSPEIEAPQVPLLPLPPANPVIGNAHQHMCRILGCGQPTLVQTNRSSKCRDHLENPPPRSREAALAAAVETGHGYCSGCNGLRPRRAPGKTCWACFCKGRRQRWGVCDGCPAFWCPNRVVQEH